jgi:hypothetical protein
MAWHDQDPRRLAQEVELMGAHTRADLLRLGGGRLAWHERLRSTTTGRSYELLVQYPDRFPFEVPRALIVSPAVEGAPHRYGDGALCLWHSPVPIKTTALTTRNRAVLWFLAYEIWTASGDWVLPQG